MRSTLDWNFRYWCWWWWWRCLLCGVFGSEMWVGLECNAGSTARWLWSVFLSSSWSDVLDGSVSFVLGDCW